MVGLFRESHNLLSVGGQLVSFDPESLDHMGEAASNAAAAFNNEPNYWTTSVVENDNVLYIRDINEWKSRVKIPGLHLMRPNNAFDAVESAYCKSKGLVDAWWRHAKVYNVRNNGVPEFIVDMPGLFAVTGLRKDGRVYAHIEGGKNRSIVVEVDYDFNDEDD